MGSGDPLLSLWLRTLRSEHGALAEDVLQRQRMFWIGSGLSRDQIDDLVVLMTRALLFIRDRAVSGDEQAEHDAALRRILEEFFTAEDLALYNDDPATWHPANVERLRNTYSSVLAMRVDGKPSNYLLMEAADVPGTYGSSDLNPGPDHYLLALLILEGVLGDMASGNWDGLIESATKELSGRDDLVTVHVVADDLRDDGGTTRLSKFHGCAVRALADPERYGEAIIATSAQIAQWSNAGDFAHMRETLRNRTRSLRSLVLGLSLQDQDLLGVFTQAAQNNPWPWDETHPAYVFGEPSLRLSQEDVLNNCYGAEFDPNRPQILERSAFGQFSRPLLAALVTYVIVEKLKATVGRRNLTAEMTAELESGLNTLELAVSVSVRSDYQRLIDFVVVGLSGLVRQYYGRSLFADQSYVPLTFGTRSAISVDPMLGVTGSDWFAFTVALIGCGLARERWKLRVREVDDTQLFEITKRGQKPVLIALVRGAVAADEIMKLPVWESGDQAMTLVHASEQPIQSARSSTSRIGAGRGATKRNEMWLPESLGQVRNADEALDILIAGAGL